MAVKTHFDEEEPVDPKALSFNQLVTRKNKKSGALRFIKFLKKRTAEWEKLEQDEYDTYDQELERRKDK